MTHAALIDGVLAVLLVMMVLLLAGGCHAGICRSLAHAADSGRRCAIAAGVTVFGQGGAAARRYRCERERVDEDWRVAR